MCSIENLYLHWDVSGAESLVCDADGNLIQGMSNKRKELKVAFKSPSDDMVYFIQVSCTGKFKAKFSKATNNRNFTKGYKILK